MDYKEILDKIISGELKEYRVSPKDAFQFQLALRSYGKRQSITGIAQRGGDIIYTLSDNKNWVLYNVNIYICVVFI